MMQNNIKLRFTFFIIIVLLGAICIVYFVIRVQLSEQFEGKWEIGSNDKNEYFIFTPNCQLPKRDPWHESIRKYIKPVQHEKCSLFPLLSSVRTRENVGNVLEINEVIANMHKNNSADKIECCYSIITRINQNLAHYNSSADNLYKTSNCYPVTKETILSNDTEFISVRCVRKSQRNKIVEDVYRNIHGVIPLFHRVISKIEKSKLENSKRVDDERKLRRTSILIIGVDSVSRLHVRRKMTKTLRFLQSNGWVELNGYNKIGLNTYPNVMGMLTGLTYDQAVNSCSPIVDHCPLIWNEFSKIGYVTAYGEDFPTISTFNYLSTGFVQPPTDYYLRPLMIAVDQTLNKAPKNSHICAGPILEVTHVLNYAKTFVQTFKNTDYFGFFWLNSLSHDDMNLAEILDPVLVDFLNNLTVSRALHNSIVFLISDHGMRFGEFRDTFQGLMEDTLPFMFVSVPKRFQERNPLMYKNLLTNRNRLTTPFDLYVTLKKQLNSYRLSNNDAEALSKACPKCASLFEEVPWNRSCDDAAIPPEWCMCTRLISISTNDVAVTDTAQFLYHYIVKVTTNLLMERGLSNTICANRTFSEIIRAYRKEVPERIPDKYKLGMQTNFYVVVIKLNPEGALFEGTVSRRKVLLLKPSFKLIGDVNRIDSYKNYSYCVDFSKEIKFYCYCNPVN